MYEADLAVDGQAPPQPPKTPPPPPRPPPPPIPPLFPVWPGVLLRRGSTGANVRTLQQMLNNSRRLYSAVPAVTVDGDFGPITENAVRTFQLFAGLTNDGVVGPLTWNALRVIV